jgi:hypothetical protein
MYPVYHLLMYIAFVVDYQKGFLLRKEISSSLFGFHFSNTLSNFYVFFLNDIFFTSKLTLARF